MITQQRKQKNDQTTDEFRMRHFFVNHEMKKQDLKDNIQHFQVRFILVTTDVDMRGIPAYQDLILGVLGKLFFNRQQKLLAIILIL